MREGGADVLHAEFVDEELRQLEHPLDRRQFSRTIAVHDADGETTVSSPANTRSKRSASGVAVRRVARVAVHLAAAGLVLGEVDLDPEPLQQLDDRAARAREQRVVEAGDEQRDPHGQRERFQR